MHTVRIADLESTTATMYTRPMHLKIRQPHAGNCPKCGMTLEPVLPTLDVDEGSKLHSFKRRFWWTLPHTILVTIENVRYRTDANTRFRYKGCCYIN